MAVRSRRRFLVQVSTGAALASVTRSAQRESPTGSEAIPLPTIGLGGHRVSRLIAGWNPIGGYSYLGPNMDRHMREYFNEDRTCAFLRHCEEVGITAHQFDPTPMMGRVLRRLREDGSQMRFICLHSTASRHGQMEVIAKEMTPIAFSHHGGVTDRLFREGKAEQVHDYVKKAHDLGFLAGISAHNPENIRTIADRGWENDFFMTCFHYLTRYSDHPELATKSEFIGKAFLKSDPQAMTRVIRHVDKPCLAFKILAAGRAGFSREGVKKAFQYAFQNIKATDAVIVGMYPRFHDEVKENADLTRQCLMS